MTATTPSTATAHPFARVTRRWRDRRSLAVATRERPTVEEQPARRDDHPEAEDAAFVAGFRAACPWI